MNLLKTIKNFRGFDQFESEEFSQITNTKK